MLIALLMLGVLLTGCQQENPERDAKIQECIDEAGTNTIDSTTLEGCKLWVCLMDNNLYNGLVERSKVTACRTAIIQSNSQVS